jgi:threonine dehydrogenase-like Zn-dependent dehydrogenase
MQALIFLKPGQVEWRDADDPVLLDPADAIVRPIAATTCDLDRLILQGRAPFQGPFALGHECIAEVLAIGPAVRSVRVGDVAVVNWHISCGTCHRCTSRRPNACSTHQTGAMYGLPGLGDWGGTFSETLRVIAADTALTKLPSGLDPVLVASAADNLPFGYEFTVPHLTAQPGADVLIMGGCGSIALYAAMFATAAGAGRVDYYDTDRDRLEIASKLGAHSIEAPPPKRAGSYPIVVDASADEAGLLCALRSVEPEGVVSSVGGHFRDIPLPLFEMYRQGVRFYTGRGRGGPNVATVLDWVASGRVDPRPVISEVAPMEDAVRVLADPSLKPVLTRAALGAALL